MSISIAKLPIPGIHQTIKANVSSDSDPGPNVPIRNRLENEIQYTYSYKEERNEKQGGVEELSLRVQSRGKTISHLKNN